MKTKINFLLIAVAAILLPVGCTQYTRDNPFDPNGFPNKQVILTDNFESYLAPFGFPQSPWKSIDHSSGQIFMELLPSIGYQNTQGLNFRSGFSTTNSFAAVYKDVNLSGHFFIEFMLKSYSGASGSKYSVFLSDSTNTFPIEFGMDTSVSDNLYLWNGQKKIQYSYLHSAWVYILLEIDTDYQKMNIWYCDSPQPRFSNASSGQLAIGIGNSVDIPGIPHIVSKLGFKAIDVFGHSSEEATFDDLSVFKMTK